MCSKSRNYQLTFNNWTEADRDALIAKQYAYLIIGKEVASTDTPHLQCYIHFVNPRSLSGVIKDFKGCHVTLCDDKTDVMVKYCQKEGDWEEFGVKPLNQKEKGLANKYADTWELAKQGNFGVLPPGQIKVWEYIANNYGPAAELDSVYTVHKWYWGPSRTGKTTKALEEMPGCYRKNGANKWWGGYQRHNPAHENVLVDDVPSTMDGYEMKRWADYHAFNAEVKGSEMLIRPKKLIVTSNFHPSEMGLKPQDLEAILNRFEFTEFKVLKDSDDTPSPPSKMVKTFHPPCVMKKYFNESDYPNCELL